MEKSSRVFFVTAAHISICAILVVSFVYKTIKRVRNRIKISSKRNLGQIPEIDIPVIDIEPFLAQQEDCQEIDLLCLQVAEALHNFGCVVVRDPRVQEHANSEFLDMMERYYSQSDGVSDARPEVGFQVGVTPGFKETPRNHCNSVNLLPDGHRPASICPPQADPKWRFFWRLGTPPKHTRFPELYADPVIPAGFPEWERVMNMWGGKMLACLEIVATMAAKGLGLESEAFTKMMEHGPHLLAPTGSDFRAHGQLGTVLAGYHYDLNFLTIHGKSRFPGLFIWLRSGRKIPVQIPEGCLLVQAGKQAEILTGGYIMAGFHEVVVSESTARVIEERRKSGKCLWRVSSTCFGAIASDQVLQPLGTYATQKALKEYGSNFAGVQVEEELHAIGLATKTVSIAIESL